MVTPRLIYPEPHRRQIGLTVTHLPAVDPKLHSLVESVETAGIGPKVRVQTAAGVISGTPVSTARFDEVSYEQLRILAVPEFRTRPVDDSETAEIAREQMGFFERRDDDGLTVLSLIDVVQDSHVGYSLEIPAMRIPLQHVLGWWVSSHNVKRPKTGLIGAGVSF
ncbi:MULTISPECIES: hypothetical protein [unclassified Nesterenkonia]|uniref:hypothetical protein n=1 Tax=unclassified Nesterenkonia TaxID=2629769 RepID=UPI001F4C5974|nr:MULTISPECIES: hypothetical protein [unclassified Nesterenkonia]MCH8561099.1 hypothetical protein [Nesterenkonia sp. DZ6]MCH8572096.1 hypothetical protein [Nesterenkonia sp. AY15]